MKKDVCPYDKKTPCSFVAENDTINQHCDFCDVYKQSHKDDDPLDGAKMLGCLGAGLIFLVLMGLSAHAIIQYFRHL